MTINFIYFDLGNVLLRFDYDVAARRVAELTGVEPAEARKIVFDDELARQYESGLVSSRQFYERICQATGAEPEYQALLDACSDMFLLNVQSAPLVASLKAAGNRLGVLSNTCEAHWQYCLRRFALLRDQFEVYALSYELGHMKPAAEIYERAAELAGVAAGEIFFTDDRLENIEAARAAGYDAVHFTTAGQVGRELRRRGLEFAY